MTANQIGADLYERLTSRKLWLALLSIGFAYWSYSLGELTAQQFQQAVMVAVTAFTAAEAASDTMAAWRPSPKSGGDEQTVNVGTEAPAVITATTEPPARRVRPSRAKPDGGSKT